MAENTGPSVNMDEVERLRYMQSFYSQQYDLVNSEMTTYAMAEETTRRNIEMLKNSTQMEKAKILVNMDGGIYMEADVKKLDKILTYVGAGYMIEKDVTEASEFLNKNQKTMKDILDKLSEDRKKLEKEIVDISYKLASLQQRA